MSIQDLGAIGELVGSIAVLITLIYLAIQIRSNTKAQATSSTWMMAQVFNETHNSIQNSAELARIISTSYEKPIEDPVDQTRLFSLMMSMVNGYFAAWRSYKNGHLGQDVYDALVRDGEILNSPGRRTLLSDVLRGRDPQFVEEFFPWLN